MPTRPDAHQRELLEYLRGLGFEELYAAKRGEATSAGPAGEPARARPRSERVAVPGARAAEEPAQARPGTLVVAPTPFDQLSFEDLKREAANCRRCRLCETRQKVVFGSGDPSAALMFVGEGPGAEEDRQGLPFVGRAGELLTKIVQAIGLSRDEVFIANVVKCRPPGNREPAPDEVAACRGFLERQIDLVRPQVLVALGRVAAQTLLGSESSLGRLRGQWFSVRGVPLRVTYHPAALLRNPDYKRPTWEDMQVVRDRLRREGAPLDTEASNPPRR